MKHIIHKDSFKAFFKKYDIKNLNFKIDTRTITNITTPIDYKNTEYITETINTNGEIVLDEDFDYILSSNITSIDLTKIKEDTPIFIKYDIEKEGNIDYIYISIPHIKIFKTDNYKLQNIKPTMKKEKILEIKDGKVKIIEGETYTSKEYKVRRHIILNSFLVYLKNINIDKTTIETVKKQLETIKEKETKDLKIKESSFLISDSLLTYILNNLDNLNELNIIIDNYARFIILSSIKNMFITADELKKEIKDIPDERLDDNERVFTAFLYPLSCQSNGLLKFNKNDKEALTILTNYLNSLDSDKYEEIKNMFKNNTLKLSEVYYTIINIVKFKPSCKFNEIDFLNFLVEYAKDYSLAINDLSGLNKVFDLYQESLDKLCIRQNVEIFQFKAFIKKLEKAGYKNIEVFKNIFFENKTAALISLLDPDLALEMITNKKRSTNYINIDSLRLVNSSKYMLKNFANEDLLYGTEKDFLIFIKCFDILYSLNSNKKVDLENTRLNYSLTLTIRDIVVSSLTKGEEKHILDFLEDLLKVYFGGLYYLEYSTDTCKSFNIYTYLSNMNILGFLNNILNLTILYKDVFNLENVYILDDFNNYIVKLNKKLIQEGINEV